MLACCDIVASAAPSRLTGNVMDVLVALKQVMDVFVRGMATNLEDFERRLDASLDAMEHVLSSAGHEMDVLLRLHLLRAVAANMSGVMRLCAACPRTLHAAARVLDVLHQFARQGDVLASQPGPVGDDTPAAQRAQTAEVAMSLSGHLDDMLLLHYNLPELLFTSLWFLCTAAEPPEQLAVQAKVLERLLSRWRDSDAPQLPQGIDQRRLSWLRSADGARGLVDLLRRGLDPLVMHLLVIAVKGVPQACDAAQAAGVVRVVVDCLRAEKSADSEYQKWWLRESVPALLCTLVCDATDGAGVAREWEGLMRALPPGADLRVFGNLAVNALTRLLPNRERFESLLKADPDTFSRIVDVFVPTPIGEHIMPWLKSFLSDVVQRTMHKVAVASAAATVQPAAGSSTRADDDASGTIADKYGMPLDNSIPDLAGLTGALSNLIDTAPNSALADSVVEAHTGG